MRFSLHPAAVYAHFLFNSDCPVKLSFENSLFSPLPAIFVNHYTTLLLPVLLPLLKGCRRAVPLGRHLRSQPIYRLSLVSPCSTHSPPRATGLLISLASCLSPARIPTPLASRTEDAP